MAQRWGKGSTVSVIHVLARSGASQGSPGAIDTNPIFPVNGLVTIVVATGRTVRRTHVLVVRGVRVSPDGRHLVYTVNTGGIIPPTGSPRWSIHVLDLTSGTARRLASDVRQMQAVSLSWAPDSRSIVWLEGPDRGKATLTL